MTTHVDITKLTRTHRWTYLEIPKRKLAKNAIIWRRINVTVDHDFLHLFSPQQYRRVILLVWLCWYYLWCLQLSNRWMIKQWMYFSIFESIKMLLRLFLYFLQTSRPVNKLWKHIWVHSDTSKTVKTMAIKRFSILFPTGVLNDCQFRCRTRCKSISNARDRLSLLLTTDRLVIF